MKNKINMEEETICNYTISKEIKQLWQCELEILEELNRICKEHNIRYFLDGGTLLGAVRHKGFIPWDNDIDVFMERNEYNRFLNIAQKELENKYFLQYYKTEKYYNRAHAQLRKLGTTAIIYGDLYNNFHKEIFIDIFPLDNIPNDKIKAEKFLSEIEYKKKYLDDYYNFYGNSFIKRIIKRIVFKLKYLFVDYDKKITEFEQFVSQYKNEETDLIGPISSYGRKYVYNKKWLNEIIYLDFEYMKLPCPSEYDKILTCLYGDYMKIPKNKNQSSHGDIFFDVNNDYKRYKNIKY